MQIFAADTLRARYDRDGYVSPIAVMSPAHVAELRVLIDRLGAARGGQLPPALNMKAHLLVPALWDLVVNPEIIASVTAVLGEDVLCWGSSFFDKPPGSTGHVRWHQDSTYWGLERPDALTAWIAFTPSRPDNGCLRVLPGTHGAQKRHRNAGDPDNMLGGGETLCETVDEDAAVDLVLEPGEMSLHHQRLVHGSRANNSTQRRMGFAIRYIAGDIEGIERDKSYATLVHGRDHGGFILEQRPDRTMDPAALRRHGAILRKANTIIHREIDAHATRNDTGRPDATDT